MTLAALLAGVILTALTAYALLGGADFGGGVWDLLATGPRRDGQRALIAHAIGPVWEANHVWLILALVALFTAFPAAFARLAIGLHIPLLIGLFGIVLRGSAFSFRAYGDSRGFWARRWGRVFSVASLVTPVVLGMAVGAVTRGLPAAGSGTFADQYVRPWLNWYCFTVGILSVSAFAFLAAVYLTVEATDEGMRDDFRRRALASAAVVGGAALVVLVLAGDAAPALREGLMHSPWSLPLHLLTAAAAVTAFWALVVRRWRLARYASAMEVTLLLWGWGLGQYPYLVPPDVSVAAAAAPDATLEFLAGALGVGAVVLIPSLFYLFRVFKARGSEYDRE